MKISTLGKTHFIIAAVLLALVGCSNSSDGETQTGTANQPIDGTNPDGETQTGTANQPIDGTNPDSATDLNSNTGDTGGDTSNVAANPSEFSNGFYLSSLSEFGPDGSLTRLTNYEVNFVNRTISAFDAMNQTGLAQSMFEFRENGDLTTITEFIQTGPDTSDERSISTLSIINGRLESEMTDVLLGSDSDQLITYNYNENNQITMVTTDFLDQQLTTTAGYDYDDTGQVSLIVEDDAEQPGQLVTSSFIWDDDTLISKTTNFSAGGISELTTFTFDGAGNILSTSTTNTNTGEVERTQSFTYEPTDVAVFNLAYQNLITLFQ